MAVASGVALGVIVILLTSGSVLGGRGARASVDPAGKLARQRGIVIGKTAGFVRDSETTARSCQPAPPSSGYVNPLRRAVLRGERIDQGVDYAGTGTLAAIGSGHITYVGTSSTGWPGAFIEYRLSSGPDRGCFVYYAEGVQPAPRLRVGQAIRPGEQLATIIPGWPTGIELGWGAGQSTKTLAATRERWTAADDARSVASPAGRSFSGLIVDLGGPAGLVEG
ncbi:MAG TPA: hypothetical protein VFP55_09600 [Solirubrobacteraceae bacterium]|nr:hypothetical protein [Solirubrobacteraceae bacterium]